MITLLAAALFAGQGAAAPDLGEIEHAVQSNRLEQARQMLGAAIAAGESGPEVDRLLADLAFAKRNWAEAATRYSQLATASPNDGRSAERAAIAEIMLGRLSSAESLVDKAITSGNASWKAWNAKGVLLDFRGDWEGADKAFANASKMKPDEPDILNNRGWSLILRGKWEEAINPLEQALILDPKSSRIQNNLELARAALADHLPERRPGESDSDFAARLNDAGVAAEDRGQRARAVAAFSRALAVKDSWYVRAANNLEKVQTP
jgi:Flp pilus assembly protein TadD